jgi:hypothetical protein
MSAQDAETIRTAHEEFAEHDAAAVLAKLDSQVEWVEGGRATRNPPLRVARPSRRRVNFSV